MTPLKFKLISQLRFNYTNNVLYEGDTTDKFHSFEQAYIGQRRKEDRVYDDETVANLPNISPNHPRADEWALRKHSLEKLKNYIVKKESVDIILEVGCGNGWMTKALSLQNKELCAIDINETELLQAARLFPSDLISFVRADIYTIPLETNSFDLIVLASSIQYFQDLKRLLDRLLTLLRSPGEIHIIDSPIYMRHEIPQAKKRTESYFTRNGQPDMTSFYFHHGYEEFINLNWKFIYNPSSLSNLLKRKLGKRNSSPFPWICIKKNGLDL